MLSYWERRSLLPEADAVIIGSGIVGLNAALRLKEREPQLSVFVVERGCLPQGASTKNAGFACFGSATELLEDLEQSSEEEVFKLVEMRYRGLQGLRRRLGDARIDYQGSGNYELFMEEEQGEYRRCMERLDYLNQALQQAIGLSSVLVPADERLSGFGFGGVSHLLWNRAEGQLDTGKMMLALEEQARSAGVRLMYGLEITGWDEDPTGIDLHCKAADGQSWTWRCRQLLAATNGFARRLLPELDVQPARNQVLVTKPLDAPLPFAGCFHYHQGYVYFRNIGERRILLGGGRHLDLQGEAKDEFGLTDRIGDYQLDMLHRHILPGRRVEVDYRWSGILGVGPVKRPIISRLSPRLCVAVRMGGMGVAIGSLVGEQGADLLLNT